MSDRNQALRIDRLLASGFRNLPLTDYTPGPSFNVIHGDNGAGKSNLIEAIQYLGSLRSFRSAKTDDMIGMSEASAILKAKVSGHSAPRKFEVKLDRSTPRKIAIDGKRPRSIALWHNAIHTVMFHPGHLALAMGGADLRRVFLDRILEQMDPVYSKTLSAYTKALRSRNRLLKDDKASRAAIASYDEILASSGAIIGVSRGALIEAIAPKAERAFAEVAGETLPLAVRYKPRVEPTEASIRNALAEAYAKDRARGFTADGPHGDDLELSIVPKNSEGVRARHHASQGQHRAIVLALKVAELDVLTERVGHVPILLLDDVSSELDRSRNRRLFEMLNRLGGQVFLTTTHPEFILLEGDRRDVRVQDGTLVDT